MGYRSSEEAEKDVIKNVRMTGIAMAVCVVALALIGILERIL